MVEPDNIAARQIRAISEPMPLRNRKKNEMFYKKLGILDGLVKCGVIKNDNLNCIQEITYKAIIDGNEYIEINLEKM